MNYSNFNIKIKFSKKQFVIEDEQDDHIYDWYRIIKDLEDITSSITPYLTYESHNEIKLLLRNLNELLFKESFSNKEICDLWSMISFIIETISKAYCRNVDQYYTNTIKLLNSFNRNKNRTIEITPQSSKYSDLYLKEAYYNSNVNNIAYSEEDYHIKNTYLKGKMHLTSFINAQFNDFDKDPLYNLQLREFIYNSPSDLIQYKKKLNKNLEIELELITESWFKYNRHDKHELKIEVVDLSYLLSKKNLDLSINKINKNTNIDYEQLYLKLKEIHDYDLEFNKKLNKLRNINDKYMNEDGDYLIQWKMKLYISLFDAPSTFDKNSIYDFDIINWYVFGSINNYSIYAKDNILNLSPIIGNEDVILEDKEENRIWINSIDNDETMDQTLILNNNVIKEDISKLDFTSLLSSVNDIENIGRGRKSSNSYLNNNNILSRINYNDFAVGTKRKIQKMFNFNSKINFSISNTIIFTKKKNDLVKERDKSHSKYLDKKEIKSENKYYKNNFFFRFKEDIFFRYFTNLNYDYKTLLPFKSKLNKVSYNSPSPSYEYSDYDDQYDNNTNFYDNDYNFLHDIDDFSGRIHCDTGKNKFNSINNFHHHPCLKHTDYKEINSIMKKILIKENKKLITFNDLYLSCNEYSKQRIKYSKAMLLLSLLYISSELNLELNQTNNLVTELNDINIFYTNVR